MLISHAGQMCFQCVDLLLAAAELVLHLFLSWMNPGKGSLNKSIHIKEP